MPGTTGTRKINYRTQEAECLWCSGKFVYTRGSGTIRKYCSAACRKAVAKKQVRDRYESLPVCSVAGCKVKATRVEAGMCETHFYRVRRNGTTDLMKFPKHRKQSAGYLMLKEAGHPLANRRGWVYTHRRVAHDKHNGLCPDCYWCGKRIDWAGCHIDHMDDDKENNQPENLEVACPSCNKTRGLLVAMFKRVKPERRDQLLGMIGGGRQGNPIDPNHHWNQP